MTRYRQVLDIKWLGSGSRAKILDQDKIPWAEGNLQNAYEQSKTQRYSIDNVINQWKAQILKFDKVAFLLNELNMNINWL